MPSTPDTPTLPRIGRKAPSFKLAASTGGTIDLRSITADGPVVLYFYPRADTPGCTKQACGFRDAASRYEKAGLRVVGVSPDPIEAVIKFARKYDLPFPLLADADHAVGERYGVWREKSLYGRKFWGVVRTTFILGEGGTVLHVFENVRPAGHEERVLAWIRANA